MNKKLITFIIILMAPLSGMGIDIYAPALPRMQQVLGITSFLSGITMTAYLVGYAVGLAFSGPLSDSFGRIRILLYGLIAYLVFTLCLLFVRNIQLLILMRFLQGVAVAGPGVMFKVLISDLYDKQMVPKMSGNTGIAWALGPVIAPFIGGFLAHHIGWRACFGFLFLYAFVLLVLVKQYLPEPNLKPTPFSMAGLFRNYAVVLSRLPFVGLVVCLAVSYGFMMMFNVTGPFLIQGALGYTPVIYGTVALILGASYFIGAIVNRIIIHHFNAKDVTYVGVFGVGVGMVALLLTGLLHVTNLFVVVSCLVVAYFFNGMVLSNVLARCILFFPDNAGTANAVMNAAFVLGSALFSVIASRLPYQNQIPLALVYVIMFVLLALVLFVLRRQSS